jgi:hypothetical protein
MGAEQKGTNNELLFFFGVVFLGRERSVERDTYSHRMKKGLLAIEPTIYCDQ